jgi:hypothetical protein
LRTCDGPFTAGEGLAASPWQIADPALRWRHAVVSHGSSFQVTGLVDPLPSGYVIALDEPHICQFWPPVTGMISWPPQIPSVTEDRVAELAPRLPVMRKG